jgi:hypothetical protein
LEYQNGAVYTGNFKDDLPHGEGVLIGADGSRYDGLFSAGRRDGEGILILPDGNRYEGLFVNDTFVGAQ